MFVLRQLLWTCDLWPEKPGDREGPSPPGPINSISWVGPGGPSIQRKWILFTSLGVLFSNYNSCIGVFGPFETLGDPFPRGPPRPSPLHLWNHFSSPACDLWCNSADSADTPTTVAPVRIIAPVVIVSIKSCSVRCHLSKHHLFLQTTVHTAQHDSDILQRRFYITPGTAEKRHLAAVAVAADTSRSHHP